MRRLPAILAPLLAAAALTACGGGDGAAGEEDLAGAARGWNVLLLSVDTVRADRLGAWGYEVRETSPRLDALLAQGARFASAQAPRAATWPSLASALTGLYPSGHGVIGNGHELPDRLPTLPLLLGEAGYQTGAFLSNMCRANHQGWDAFACAHGADRRANRKALAWVETLDPDRPYLLWLHYMAAHPPYYNGGGQAARWDPGYEGPVAPRKRLLDRIMQEPIPLSPRDVTHLDAVYDAALRGTDELSGALLEELRRRGLLERTVIVFLADHGEDLYDHHGYLYHACSVYQTSLHVPLGVVVPGVVPAGAVVEQTVELIDVLPTVLGLLGIEPPAEQHGVSLLPYLADPETERRSRPAFSEYGDSQIRTVLAGRFKLVNNPQAITPRCMEGVAEDFYPIGRTELYDLEADPQERVNLAASRPEKVAELQELIGRRWAQLTNRVRRQELPDEVKEQLRALGYVAD